MEFRKFAWVSIEKLHTDYGVEKGVEKLAEMGVEEALPIVSTGRGALFPSKVRPQPEHLKGKDLVAPFIKEAKKRGMKVHAWIVSLNFPNEEFVSSHRDWYVVNRLGISCVDKPPYIPGYKWLCPSRPEVRENLAQLFLEVAEKYDVDGLHFDYIRLPDVLLPKGLRSKYPGVPREDVIKPEFDFCYCSSCREGYKAEEGVDPVNVPYGTEEYEKWFAWRSRQVTETVKHVLSKVRASYPGIEVSAAVFATPTLAYRYVFQKWPEWGLDIYHPMIYHRYYEQDVEWIGEAVKEGVEHGVKISAGVLVGFMRSYEELLRGFKSALDNGAAGITVFVFPPPQPELADWIRKALEELRRE